VFIELNDSFQYTIKRYIWDIREYVPSERDSAYINNQINIFMNEWIKQRDKDVKISNYKRLQDVEDEMNFLINHEIPDS
jgi:hypothetical protein